MSGISKLVDAARKHDLGFSRSAPAYRFPIVILAATVAIAIAVIVAIQLWPERMVEAAGLAPAPVKRAKVRPTPTAPPVSADVQRANEIASTGWAHRTQNDVGGAARFILDAARIDAAQLPKAITTALNRGDVAFAKELHEQATAATDLHPDPKFMAWAAASIAAGAAQPAPVSSRPVPPVGTTLMKPAPRPKPAVSSHFGPG